MTEGFSCLKWWFLLESSFQEHYYPSWPAGVQVSKGPRLVLYYQPSSHHSNQTNNHFVLEVLELVVALESSYKVFRHLSSSVFCPQCQLPPLLHSFTGLFQKQAEVGAYWPEPLRKGSLQPPPERGPPSSGGVHSSRQGWEG